MNKQTEQIRLHIFLLISVLMAFGYQVFHNNRNDKMIMEAVEEHNKRVVRYVRMANELMAERDELKLDLMYYQAAYKASKTHAEQLKRQMKK